jgi:translation initiation factor 2B subunit (eIF-2B alpha/beta/delta family)
VVQVLLAESPSARIERQDYIDIARYVLSRAPAFALLGDLLHTVGSGLFSSPAVAHVTPTLFRRAVQGWKTRWLAAGQATARGAAEHLGQVKTLVTLSNSGAVFLLLQQLRDRGRSVSVVCAESLPGGEGAAFVRSARRAGLNVTQIEDRALPGTLQSCDAAVVGADAVFADGFRNKVGSLRLALAARHHRRPFVVLAESAKWVPESWGPSGDQVGLDSFCRLRSGSSDLFELVPITLVTGLISEHGILDPVAVPPRIHAKPLFAPLCAGTGV